MHAHSIIYIFNTFMNRVMVFPQIMPWRRLTRYFFRQTIANISEKSVVTPNFFYFKPLLLINATTHSFFSGTYRWKFLTNPERTAKLAPPSVIISGRMHQKNTKLCTSFFHSLYHSKYMKIFYTCIIITKQAQ